MSRTADTWEALRRRLPRQPPPNPRQAAMLVLVALSVGVVAGRALDADGPGSVVLSSSSPAGEPDPEQAEAGSSGGTLSAPAGNAEAEPAPPAPEPVEPAPAAPVEPAAEPSEPLEEAPVAEEPADDEPADQGDSGEADESEQATPITGTVVHVNPAAKSYALATADGELIAVHSTRLPEPGARLRARVSRETDGTTREVRRAELGEEPSARLRGTVTFVAPDLTAYAVSVRGTSLLVHSAADRTLPALLDLVMVEVRLEEADPAAGPPVRLVEASLEIEGRASGAVDLTGTVQSVDPAGRTVLLSADDLRESGSDLAMAVAPELDLKLFDPGRAITATVEIGADGSYRITEAEAARAPKRPSASGARAPVPPRRGQLQGSVYRRS